MAGRTQNSHQPALLINTSTSTSLYPRPSLHIPNSPVHGPASSSGSHQNGAPSLSSTSSRGHHLLHLSNRSAYDSTSARESGGSGTSDGSGASANKLAERRGSIGIGGFSSKNEFKKKSQQLKSVQRAEARKGVTTEFVDLSLHSACANGNVGLVKYALMNGQPVNSVLNGVLPLHAAASSGNETIVRMLIDSGADVNSPRLPRRYSSDRSRASASAVGTAGSTPLHFAAANGHTGVIQILLSWDADPLMKEKYGQTPKTIAKQNGHTEAADLLRDWEAQNGIRGGKGESRTHYAEGGTSPGSQHHESLDGDNDSASLSGTSLRSSIAGRSMLESVRSSLKSKTRLHPQKSFDNLALKIAHSNPHLPSILTNHGRFGHGNNHLHPHHHPPRDYHHSVSPSLTSLTSLHPVASSSSVSNTLLTNEAGAGFSQGIENSPKVLREDLDTPGFSRKPSLPHVLGNAAHGFTTLRRGSGSASAVNHSSRRMSDVSRGFSTEPVAHDDSPFLDTGSIAGQNIEEQIERLGIGQNVPTNSLEIATQSSGSGDMTSAAANMAPRLAATSSTTASGQADTLPNASPAKGGVGRSRQGSAASSYLAQTFYRPRHSSQLSGQSQKADVTDGDTGSKAARVFAEEDDEGYVGGENTHGRSSMEVSHNSNQVLSQDTPRPSMLIANSANSEDATAPYAVQYSGASDEGSAEGVISRRSKTHYSNSAHGGGMSPSISNEEDDVRKFVLNQRVRASSLTSTISSDHSVSAAHFVRRPPGTAPGGSTRSIGGSLHHSPSTDHLSPNVSTLPPAESNTVGRPETRGHRSNSAGTDGGYSASASSYTTDRGTVTSSASNVPSTSTPSTSIGRSSPPVHYSGRSSTQNWLPPLYETNSAVSATSASTSVPTKVLMSGEPPRSSENGMRLTKAEAHARVKKVEQELLAFDPKATASTSADDSITEKKKPTLAEHLAAYGQSLALERNLVALDEKDMSNISGGKYHFETIGKDGSRKLEPAVITGQMKQSALTGKPMTSEKESTTHVPQWRAVPTHDFLAPPPSNSGRRSVSPSQGKIKSSSSSVASLSKATPSADTASLKSDHQPSAIRSKASTDFGQDSTPSADQMRAPSRVQNIPSGLPSASGTSPAIQSAVIGDGMHGVSYIEVIAPTPRVKDRASKSDKAHSAGKGGGSATSSKDQVLMDAAEQQRIADSIPRASITSEKRKGFARKFFGGKR